MLNSDKFEGSINGSRPQLSTVFFTNLQLSPRSLYCSVLRVLASFWTPHSPCSITISSSTTDYMSHSTDVSFLSQAWIITAPSLLVSLFHTPNPSTCVNTVVHLVFRFHKTSCFTYFIDCLSLSVSLTN